MRHINQKVDQFKEEDGVLHSIYFTPAESLCKTQVDQFRLKYGIIENVSDRDYFTNGFHCHVSEDITPIEKQDLEGRFLDMGKGGQIFFNRFNSNYNTEAFKTLVRRAMKKGFYYGTNLNLSYCEECGYEELEITSINRVCGYLGFSKVKGDTRFNEGKLAEVKDRVSY
jgi:ribonucleoside-triphosphate reductase